MRKIALLSLFIFICIPGLRAQSRLVNEKPLPIMAWAGIPQAETNLAKFNELKEMGINICLNNYQTTDEMLKALDVAKACGIRMMTSCPELKSDVEKTVKKSMNHPALAGYFLRDEPLCSDMPALGEWARKIQQTDKVHPLFVNLIASIHPTNTEALGAPTYAEYVKTFIREVPTSLLSFDFYPVLTEGIHDRWYEGLEIFSNEARKAGKPFWAFALASSYNELHPIPTMAALRLQLYSNLAYGAQGLEYWSYRQSEGLRSAPIDMNGKRTVVYDRIKAVNKEIQDISGVFTGSKVVSVNHTGTIIPRGTNRLFTLPKAIKVFETEGQGALVSILEKGEQTFFVIVNRDLEKNMPYVISGDSSLKRVLKDGTIVDATTYSHSLEIEPGDIAVYLFPTNKQN
jgi:hypothetical protein